MDESRIAFASLEKTDLDNIYMWLNTDHVRFRWGNKDISREEVEKQYGPLVTKSEPTLGFIIMYDSRSIGFIQAYKIDDYLEYKKQIDITENAAGMDLFIGDKNFVGKGLGPLVIKKFVHEIVFKTFDVVSCIVDPAADNLASVNSFKKAGFEYVKDVTEPETGEKEVLLRLEKK